MYLWPENGFVQQVFVLHLLIYISQFVGGNFSRGGGDGGLTLLGEHE